MDLVMIDLWCANIDLNLFSLKRNIMKVVWRSKKIIKIIILDRGFHFWQWKLVEFLNKQGNDFLYIYAKKVWTPKMLMTTFYPPPFQNFVHQHHWIFTMSCENHVLTYVRAIIKWSLSGFILACHSFNTHF
jgi:hypothetical protein